MNVRMKYWINIVDDTHNQPITMVVINDVITTSSAGVNRAPIV